MRRRVGVNDVEGVEEVAASIVSAGGRAVGRTGSVTEPEVASALVRPRPSSFGRLDGLVTNAGLTHFAEPREDEPDVPRSVIEVNVLGTMYCGTAAEVTRGGSTVNVVSGATLGRSGRRRLLGLDGRGGLGDAVAPPAWTPMVDSDPRAE